MKTSVKSTIFALFLAAFCWRCGPNRPSAAAAADAAVGLSVEARDRVYAADLLAASETGRTCPEALAAVRVARARWLTYWPNAPELQLACKGDGGVK